MTQPKVTVSSLPSGAGGASAQPPAFIPTGKGLQNRLPSFAAHAGNANGILTNLAAAQSQDYLYKLYLFVHDVETGYSLSGNYGQGNFAKTFYPRNLQQDSLVIVGQAPSQHEYDKIVRFVEHSHRTVLASPLPTEKSWIDFKLLPHTDPPIRHPLQAGQTRRTIHPGMHYGVVIEDVEAGHERFKQAPLVRLTCKVLNDFMQPPVEVDQAIYNSLVSDYIKTFGNTYDPNVGVTTAAGTPTGRGGVVT